MSETDNNHHHHHHHSSGSSSGGHHHHHHHHHHGPRYKTVKGDGGRIPWWQGILLVIMVGVLLTIGLLCTLESF